MIKAGEGNRTLVSSLGSYSSAIELHPRRCPPSTLRICRWGRNHARGQAAAAARLFDYRQQVAPMSGPYAWQKANIQLVCA
jgi:hypothetical protein